MLDHCTPWPPAQAERWRTLGLWQGLTLGRMLDASAGLGRTRSLVSAPEYTTSDRTTTEPSGGGSSLRGTGSRMTYSE